MVAQSVSWLNQRRHLGLPQPGESGHSSSVDAAREVLERIYVALGGDLDTLAGGRPTRLPGDFIHESTGTLIEVDESQHFTSMRRASLDLYPQEVALGFDLEQYKGLCDRWQAKSDGYYRTEPARCFGIGGRQKQRAYYDALRDLATPAMGRPPLIRVEAAERDPADAHRRHRGSLLTALGVVGSNR